MSYAEYLGYDIRILDDYDSAIFYNERRIAYREGYALGSSRDCHFILQNSNGYWSGKLSFYPSRLYSIFNPNVSSLIWEDIYFSEELNEYRPTSYFSQIYYFGIRY